MPEKTPSPAEPVTITLPMEQWQTVLHWLQYGADYHNAKRHECLANCKDARLAAEWAAVHEKAEAHAENVYKIIDQAIMEDSTNEKPES